MGAEGNITRRPSNLTHRIRSFSLSVRNSYDFPEMVTKKVCCVTDAPWLAGEVSRVEFLGEGEPTREFRGDGEDPIVL